MRITYALALAFGLTSLHNTAHAQRTDSDIVAHYRISSSTDDAEERREVMSLRSSDLDLQRHTIVGLRFTGVDIPNGAIVKDAYIQFKAEGVDSASASLEFRAQAADNAARFTSRTRDLSRRPLTRTSVAWSPRSWKLNQAGSAQRTSNLAAVIQEIIDRSGWAAGNALAFIVSSRGERDAVSYDEDRTSAPSLRVTYATATPTVPTAPAPPVTQTPPPATDPVPPVTQAPAPTTDPVSPTEPSDVPGRGNGDTGDGPLSAFFGAQGHGARARGGRGGRIIEVTNLRDSGPGSLRAALEASGPRIVVFRVGGTIELKREIRIKQPYVTVAGQTAPGDGIMLRAESRDPITLLRVHSGGHNVVVRYLRLRNGSGEARGAGKDNITVNSGHDIIFDHVSMSWSTDENLAIYTKRDPISRITVQRSIMAEGLEGHSNGLIIGGSRNGAWRSIEGISIHHNLFVHNTHRNPRVTAASTEVINNVVYNWRSRAGSSTNGSAVDFRGNYLKPGPMSNLSHVLLHEHYRSATPDLLHPAPSIYTAGNVVEGVHDDPRADNWDMHKIHYSYAELPSRFRRNAPLRQGAIPVAAQSAFDAYASVLGDVGANARLDCRGRWVATIDDVDARLIADVENEGGPADAVAHPDDAGGYPGIRSATPCADADRDGMPDQWENLYGFNRHDPRDGPRDADGDGYTNVEEFLNGTDPG